VAVGALERISIDLADIDSLPRKNESLLIQQMLSYSKQTHWVYTEDTMYPFHAGLLVIPELSVLPLKRFWSGQITDKEIAETVSRYRPEQILINDERGPGCLEEILVLNYSRVYQGEGHSLYVLTRLLARPL
jgi:hypothetical protein